jgi:hypothetical protein
MANGNDLGNYLVQEGSIYLENFPPSAPILPGVSVCAVVSPDCCDVVEFATPNCEGGGTCHIFDLYTEVGECTSDSTFVIAYHLLQQQPAW